MDVIEQQILNRVKQVCRNVLKVKEERIVAASRFKEDLGADSLDILILLMELEEEFKGGISDQEAAGLKTVQDVISFIKVKQFVPV